MAAVSSDLYDVRLRRPRVTLSDLIVLVVALISFGIGWAYKDWHDNRLRTVDVGGITVAYPRGWLSFPAFEPEVFRAVSNDDSRQVIFLTRVTTPQTDVLQAITTNNANPARSEPGFTQLSNETATFNGNAAVGSDYAYVLSSVGGSTVPSVILGRQLAWIANGELVTFAIEGPEDRWGVLQEDFDRMIEEMESSA